MRRLLIFPALLIPFWVVCFLPWSALIHWASNTSWKLLMPVGIVACAIYIMASLRALRNGPDWLAFVLMQFMGIGAVGWVAALVALFAEAVIPGFNPLWPFVLVWLTLIALGLYRALKIEDRLFTLVDSRIEAPLRLVQISDVHVGSRRPAFLQKVVDQIKSHEPDIVLITGDLLDLSQVDAKDLSALKQLTCPVLMCTGNHERYVNFDKAMQAIAEQNVTVLRNSQTVINGVNFIGIDDSDNPQVVADVLDQLKPDQDLYSVILYHRPDGWQHVKARKLPLMLAGHTHKGQIWPFEILVKTRFPEIAGWYRENDSALYVSCGTGTWGPSFRLGSRCEIGIFDLAGH